jgi:hypothetical protein
VVAAADCEIVPGVRGTGVESAASHAPAAPRASTEPAQPRLVVAAGALMVGAHLIFRGWALYPSWFYTDDYRLLYDARSRGLSWSYLMAPFDSQFMPFGRLAAWLLASAGELNWTLCATMTLIVQAGAATACLWMLCTVFGPRPAVLLPLGVYLTCAMTMPAMMWWAASLNQVPLQVVLFSSVALGVRYLRSRRLLWLLLTVLMLALGLLCYVKALLVIPVLAFLALGYFASGSLVGRAVGVLRAYWVAAILLGVVGGAYVLFYVTQVPQLFEGAEGTVAGPLAQSMLGTSFLTGVWGGPWRWSPSNPPVAYADPPAWTVLVAWSLMLLVVLYGYLTRERTLRSWVLLSGYVAALYVLLATTRAPIVGGTAGLEYRYLTDSACLLALCVGLAFLPVPGSAESSGPRDAPMLTVRAGRATVCILTALVCASGLVTSAQYARIWHTNNPGHDFVANAGTDLRRLGRVDLADRVVPPTVIANFSYPDNTTRRLAPLIDDRVHFPSVTARLRVLADDGTLHPAVIKSKATAVDGPLPDCGWKVVRAGTDIPLNQAAQGFASWVRIGYLASGDSPVTVILGAQSVHTEVTRGLHSLYLHTDEVFDRVSVHGLAAGTTLCVDTIEVGEPVPAEEGLG